MKSILTAILMGVAVLLVVSSCATVPTGPLALGEVRLISINVPGSESIRANIAYVANIIFEADGKPEITRACFYWSGDGPYCFKVTDVNYGSPGTIKVQLRTANPGSYALESYVLYIKDGKTVSTNVVGSRIYVFRQ